MTKGYLSFVLHAHLPYVRHPEFEQFLEERWLFEAISETYIPLLRMCEGLHAERVPFRITLSISPSLLAMLEDELLQDRYRKHLINSLALAEKEIVRHAHDGHFKWLAEYYRSWFTDTLSTFDKYQGRISTGFRKLHEAGCLELITTAATHGFLPLLSAQPPTVKAQVATGLDYFAQVFGFRAKGMWLPECAYYPTLDKILAAEGVRFFFTESIGIDHASTAPFYGVYAPLFTPSGVAVFGRDQGSTKQVWSAEEGFPGDGDYREFYRDIGHELDFDYLRPHMPGDVRADTGFKYHRITRKSGHKEAYNPHNAKLKAAQHAQAFVDQRIGHIEHLASLMATPPVVLAPFDAELFGHWWFEGPQWLDYVIRKCAFDQDTLQLIAPSDYLSHHPVHQCGYPATSTWGHKGYAETWINPSVDWIYEDLLACGRLMTNLANRFHQKAAKDPLLKRALDQCVRELLLAQSSDWPFIISNGTSAEYAARRVRDHVSRFHWLSDAIENNCLDTKTLSTLEYLDNPFPTVNLSLYCDSKNAD